MIVRSIAAIGCALALARAAAAEPLAAVAVAPDPLASVLVGPSGQVWDPDGHGGWSRTREGGVAADVGGAMLTSTLVVIGRATPPYRLAGDHWQAVRLGERGKTLAGTGPRPAMTIGRQVFVWKTSAWVRIGTAPAAVVAVWAASDAKVYIAGAGRIWRLAGKRLVEHATASVVAFASGPTPLALTADGKLYDLTSRTATPIAIGADAVTPTLATTAPDGTAWVAGQRAGGFVLARRVRGAWQEVAAPAVAADDRPVALAIGADGAALLALASGAVWVQPAGGAWTAAPLTDARTPRGPGPGPARMP
ncbi:MAG: hypothetical protein IPL61_04225 [Myxococcales bacterium]|nr:hypothetical protein [Myxococcales bacterium]